MPEARFGGSAVAARELFHGANGDKILAIIADKLMRPAGGEVFFSENRPESVLMHGADLTRKLTFAVKVRVQIPDTITLVRKSTPGVQDTLVLQTNDPVSAEVLELYIRRPGATQLEVIRGADAIKQFLQGGGGGTGGGEAEQKALTELERLRSSIQHQLDLESGEHKAQLDLATNSFAGFWTNRLFNTDPPPMAIWNNAFGRLVAARTALVQRDVARAVQRLAEARAFLLDALRQFRTWKDGIDGAGVKMQWTIAATAIAIPLAIAAPAIVAQVVARLGALGAATTVEGTIALRVAALAAASQRVEQGLAQIEEVQEAVEQLGRAVRQ